MAKTRFFQHLNENNIDFQKVTTLECIDNLGDGLMYYFKDGSKCNKEFIAPINASSIQGFEFAEVSSPSNIWKLKKIIPHEEKPRVMTNANGELCEAPSWTEYTNSKTVAKTRVDIVGKPMHVDNIQIPNDSEYFIDTLESTNMAKDEQKEVFNFNVDNISVKSQPKENKQLENNQLNDNLLIDVKDILKRKKVSIVFENGNRYEMTPEEFIENALTPKEEKVVEKIVEKEVLVKTPDSNIDLGIDNNQKALIDNMIDMSNKTEYPIDMELTLSLPPASVYKLIKTVYPEGMARGFVNIIANRMQVAELKTAVAEGLLAFYDESTDDEYTEDNQSTELTKKSGRPSKKVSSK